MYIECVVINASLGRLMLWEVNRLVDALSKVCRGQKGFCQGGGRDGQRHKHCEGRTAKDAECYPPGLCKAICIGLLKQMRMSDRKLKMLVRVNRLMRVQEVEQKGKLTKVQEIEQKGQDGEDFSTAWDDASDEFLDLKEVRRARLKELEFIEKKQVWKRIKRKDAEKMGYKIVKTRWIDINKGDRENPLHRSRFVAKEFNDGAAEGLFASTPPLEALRILISDAATWRRGGEEKVIMVNDVARAFFEAPARRLICVELPEEARGQSGDDEVGLL